MDQNELSKKTTNLKMEAKESNLDEVVPADPYTALEKADEVAETADMLDAARPLPVSGNIDEDNSDSPQDSADELTPADNSSFDNSEDLKKVKNNWRTIGIILSVVTVILLILISFLYFYSSQKIAEGTKQIKHYQKELTDSKTVIAEYESATKSKVVDTKDQTETKNDEKKDQKTDKQIVKWNDLNINFAQLTTLIGDDHRITGGRIVTNEDGTKVIAKLTVSKMEKIVDPNGLAMPRYVDHGMAVQTNVYTRKLPSGSWQYVGVYAANGMGAVVCKDVSEEMKAAVTVLNKYEPDPNMKYSCVTYKDGNPVLKKLYSKFFKKYCTSIFYKTMLK